MYSGVPAEWLGRKQVVEVGPMSGASNAKYWLEERNLPADEETVALVMKAAKASDHVLTEDEIRAVLNERNEPTKTG